jgi:hypothetical protein
VPPYFRVVEASTCVNVSKSPDLLLGMPMPVSRTEEHGVVVARRIVGLDDVARERDTHRHSPSW